MGFLITSIVLNLMKYSILTKELLLSKDNVSKDTAIRPIAVRFVYKCVCVRSSQYVIQGIRPIRILRNYITENFVTCFLITNQSAARLSDSQYIQVSEAVRLQFLS
jgi:hypothetical protein